MFSGYGLCYPGARFAFCCCRSCCCRYWCRFCRCCCRCCCCCCCFLSLLFLLLLFLLFLSLLLSLVLMLVLSLLLLVIVFVIVVVDVIDLCFFSFLTCLKLGLTICLPDFPSRESGSQWLVALCALQGQDWHSREMHSTTRQIQLNFEKYCMRY